MLALQIHPEKCTGCKQCELACSYVQIGAFQPARSVIKVHVFDEQASFAPYTCFQCDEAWCMQACPVNAIALDGASGAKVDVYREGSRITTTANDGAFTDYTGQNGGGTLTYQVCEEGSVTSCSDPATAAF